MANCPTPHINTTPDKIAKTVLMPGDPLRAKFIAETFLDDAELFTSIRGILGYTGRFDGKRVSVMASGMGVPSIGIYSYELFNFFDVDNIIRVGTAGGFSDRVKLRDIVLGMGACTNSNYVKQFHLPGDFAPIAGWQLLSTCVEQAKKLNLKYEVGNLLTSDVFYGDEADLPASQKSSAIWGKMGVLAVEMEAAGLYANAARAGKNALAICTISDHLLTGEATTADERQSSFTDMMKLALHTAVSL